MKYSKYLKETYLKPIIFLWLISKINSLYYRTYDTIHINSEYSNSYTLNDGNVLVLSPDKNLRKTKISKLNSEGDIIYGNRTLDIFYNDTTGFVQINSVNEPEGVYLFFYHDSNSVKDEYIITFNDEGQILKKVKRKNILDDKIDVFSLKNGNIILSTLNKINSIEKTINASLSLVQKDNQNILSEVYFNIYNNYMSCYEHQENEIYCIYFSN